MLNSGTLKCAVAAAFCATFVAACGGGSDGANGTVSMSLIDRPVDGVTALYVTITAVRIKPKGEGPAIELPMTTTPLTVDLLSLSADEAAVLVDEAVVDANDYNWVEFDIDDSDVTKSYAMTLEGGQVPVDIDVPGNSVRLVSGFTVGANQAVRFLFDWEADRALVDAVGRNLYILKPAFRILRADAMGSVSGRVTSATAMTDTDCNTAPDPMVGKVVYFFDGMVTPDDVDGVDPEPVTTVDAVYDMASGDYLYRTVLLPGQYTVALTCFGDLETDNGDEDLRFLAPMGDSLIDVSASVPVENVDF